jgi:hypothetical protein
MMVLEWRYGADLCGFEREGARQERESSGGGWGKKKWRRQSWERLGVGYINPRFGARENVVDLGSLNFAYHYVGAMEDSADLATLDFLGPRPSDSAPGSYGADMNDFGANRDGAEPRGQTTK